MLFAVGASDVYAQKKKGLQIKKGKKSKKDSLITPVQPVLDTIDLQTAIDTTTAGQEIKRPAAVVKMSKDSLDAPVSYQANDSMIYDIANELVYLYGEAEVQYDGMTLTANYIEFDWKNSIATAIGEVDSLTGKTLGKPFFKNDDNEFEANKMRYNFKTQKGKVYDVRTQEGDGYLLSQGVKFDLRSNINKDENDVVYAEATLYTTCDLDHPHFGIRSKKAKVIPRKLIVVGPSNVEISDVPTPLWLPFGFFPIQKGQRSGLVFPRDYEFSPALGFGLRNVGYYFAGSEHMDLTVLGDIYTRGSWGLSASTNYRKRYKYNGSFGASFSSRRFGYKETPEFSKQNDFNIRWNHNQDNRAHPTRTFRASMNIGTGSYFRNNQNDAESVLTNTLSSNVSVNKRWIGKPYTLSASFRHDQNTRTRSMNISFPVVDFRVSRIFPFKRKTPLGNKERWYEKVSLSYTTQLQNRITTQDTSLFKKEVLEDFRYGWQHDLPISANFRVFKYFTLTPQVNYSEKWYLNTIEKDFIEQDSLDENGDLVEYGYVEDLDRFGFKSQREVRGSMSLNTKLFGTLNFKGKKLKAIRHVMTPTVSANFSPDYSSQPWNYYRTVRNDIDDEDSMLEYTIFEDGIFGRPSKGRQAALNWSIANVLEAKVLSRKDSVVKDKKIKLLNSFTINSGYNFAADSLNFSNIGMSGNTQLFKKINVNFGASFDPYAYVEGNRVNTYNWTANRRFLNFRSASLNLSTRINPNDLRNLFVNDFNNQSQGPQDQTDRNQGSNNNLIGSLSFTYSLRIGKFYENGKDTIKVTTNSINLSRTTINITPKWRINIGNIGYDFVAKRITYPDLGFYRDLHCWEMGLNIQPERKTYSFYIRVKPSSLDFLNMPYKRNQADPIEF